MIGAIICLIIAIGCICYSMTAYRQKGPMLSTLYLIATPKQREKMKTKQKYFFIATTFLGFGMLFFLVALWLLTNVEWLFYFVVRLIFLIVVYVIVGSIRRLIRKK